jgi:hypothetical protein
MRSIALKTASTLKRPAMTGGSLAGFARRF